MDIIKLKPIESLGLQRNETYLSKQLLLRGDFQRTSWFSITNRAFGEYVFCLWPLMRIPVLFRRIFLHGFAKDELNGPRSLQEKKTVLAMKIRCVRRVPDVFVICHFGFVLPILRGCLTACNACKAIFHSPTPSNRLPRLGFLLCFLYKQNPLAS